MTSNLDNESTYSRTFSDYYLLMLQFGFCKDSICLDASYIFLDAKCTIVILFDFTRTWEFVKILKAKLQLECKFAAEVPSWS